MTANQTANALPNNCHRVLLADSQTETTVSQRDGYNYCRQHMVMISFEATGSFITRYDKLTWVEGNETRLVNYRYGCEITEIAAAREMSRYLKQGYTLVESLDYTHHLPA